MPGGVQVATHHWDEVEENVILPQLWKRMNLTDRLYAGLYLLLGAAIFLLPGRVPHWSKYLILHILVIEAIALLAWFRDQGRWCRFAHDWYPILLFVVIFEEIARLSLVFVPHWQDGIILHLEHSVFSVPPTVWAGRFQNLVLVELLEFGYFTFYWIFPLVGGVLYGEVWHAQSPVAADDKRQPYRIWMDALAMGYMVCYAFFLLMPTEGPARTLAAHHATITQGGPFRWIVLLIQKNGGVHGNAFPSGHVMASVVSLLAAWRWRPRLGYWLALPVLLLCAGAVYDRYHYVSDVVAGAVIGAAAFWLVARFRNPQSARVA